MNFNLDQEGYHKLLTSYDEIIFSLVFVYSYYLFQKYCLSTTTGTYARVYLSHNCELKKILIYKLNLHKFPLLEFWTGFALLRD